MRITNFITLMMSTSNRLMDPKWCVFAFDASTCIATTSAFYSYINETNSIYNINIRFLIFVCCCWFFSSYSLLVVRSFIRFYFEYIQYIYLNMCAISTFPILWESDKRLRVVIYDIIFAIFIKLSNWHQKSEIMMKHSHTFTDTQMLDADFPAKCVTLCVRMHLLRFQWWEWQQSTNLKTKKA